MRIFPVLGSVGQASIECIGLPVCTADYPEMDIREKIPMPTTDEQGYFPAHDDVLEVSQMEAGYLDKLNRVQLKVHQMDCAINIGLVTYFRNLKKQTAEGNTTKIQEEMDKIKPDEIISAACRNAHVKEQSLAKSTAITLACIRRDNAMRKGWTHRAINAAVSRPIIKDSETEEMNKLLKYNRNVYTKMSHFCCSVDQSTGILKNIAS